MIDRKPYYIALAIAGLLILIVTLLVLLPRAQSGAATVQRIKQNGELVVLTRNAPTTYYEDRDGLAGPEYDLVQSFAQTLGVTARYVLKDSVDATLMALRGGEGDLVAAGITRTDARESSYLFAAGYQTIQQQVVCQRGPGMPAKPADLVGKSIAVIAGSSYLETLDSWKLELPALSWNVSDDNATEQHLASISDRQLDCTLADSNIVALNQRYFPELAVAFPASEEQNLAWVMLPGADDLAEAIDSWLETAESSGELAAVMERYYGHVEVFDYVDLRAFRRRIKSRLPKYRAMFVAAAEKHGLPWTLLAAQAYQESHWNPNARSPTGVRGLMMLTQPTAKAMGVKKRLDPAQSVAGGARYLDRMLSRVPAEVVDTDRLWYALAAYNIGMGHVHDARTLSQRLGRNPDVWHEFNQVLPLLAKKQYYKDLRHGYARGSEPVRYVQRIRNYQEILEHSLR